MVTLAFYKGKGGVFAALVRFATRSQYSHVELIPGRAIYGETVACYSSSERDGGVRFKLIYLDPHKWDLVPVSAPPKTAISFITEKIGLKYDWLGIILSQVLNLRRERPLRWYCSEICAAALDIEPTSVSPGDLHKIILSIERRDQRISQGRAAKFAQDATSVD